MPDILENIIDEVAVAGVVRKQRSITSLFPTFPARVQKVGDMGGIRLIKSKPDVWEWDIHSGTKEGVWYQGRLQFKDMNVLIAKHAADMRLWTQDKTHVDLRKLAKAILFDADVKISCSCPAAQYWGPNYILSKPKYDAKYGRQEDRRPRVRNPREYGMLCKHLQVLINVLPFYITTMATWLKEQFASQIAFVEKDTLKTKGQFKAAAAELKRRKVEPPEEGPPETPPTPAEPKAGPPSKPGEGEAEPPKEEPEAEKEMPAIKKEPKPKIPLPTEPKEEPEEPIVPDEKRPELDRKAKLLKKKEKEAPKEKPKKEPKELEKPEEITPRGRLTEPPPPSRPRVKKVEEPPTEEEEGPVEITPRGRKSPEVNKRRLINKAKPPEEGVEESIRFLLE